MLSAAGIDSTIARKLAKRTPMSMSLACSVSAAARIPIDLVRLAPERLHGEGAIDALVVIVTAPARIGPPRSR